MRMWRNWQTRRFQVPVGNTVWVRIPSSAPKKKNTACVLLFWYEPTTRRDLRVEPFCESKMLCLTQVTVTIKKHGKGRH